MAIDFPDSPTTGQIFAGPHGTFTWDGTKWAPVTTGAFGDAPSDGNQYARQNAAWSQVVIPPAGGLVAFNAYTASQTITIPAGASKAVVELWGGTGGTGGVGQGSATACYVGATGAGGYLRKYLSGLTAGYTLVYAQGAAGSAGVGSGGGSGGNGGASTLASGTQNIATLTANGSNGSAGYNAASATSATSSTAGGTATGGDVNLTGQRGTYSAYDPTSGFGQAAIGGVTMYSHGTDGGYQAGLTAGRAGQPGGCQIWWFT